MVEQCTWRFKRADSLHKIIFKTTKLKSQNYYSLFLYKQDKQTNKQIKSKWVKEGLYGSLLSLFYVKYRSWYFCFLYSMLHLSIESTFIAWFSTYKTKRNYKNKQYHFKAPQVESHKVWKCVAVIQFTIHD